MLNSYQIPILKHLVATLIAEAVIVRITYFVADDTGARSHLTLGQPIATSVPNPTEAKAAAKAAANAGSTLRCGERHSEA